MHRRNQCVLDTVKAQQVPRMKSAKAIREYRPMSFLLPIFAQAPVPVNPGTVDLISFVTKALDAIVAPTSGIFLATAQPVLDKLGLLALVLGALTWTYSYLSGNHIFR
jgi:hypothetical protein